MSAGMPAVPIPFQDYLTGLDYPVSKEDVLRVAQETGADTETLRLLHSLPVERFDTPEDLTDLLPTLNE